MAAVTLPNGAVVDDSLFTWVRQQTAARAAGIPENFGDWVNSLGGADPALAPQTPSATDVATWADQRRQLGTNLGNATAQNNFDRGNLQAQQSLDTQSLGLQYDRMRQALPGQYANRGLLNSGIYGQKLQEYGENKAHAYGQLAQDYSQKFGQNTLQQNQNSSNYYSGSASVDTNEAARRQDLASQLRSVA